MQVILPVVKERLTYGVIMQTRQPEFNLLKLFINSSYLIYSFNFNFYEPKKYVKYAHTYV